ncbi:hypothetical protein [Streptomyces sp. NPDC048603]|uniref:hypothetical protein n=1 Tax=Streptomyces sp. NPDC048603 TaxID=3365577 RepID=UPI0037122C6C
MSTVRRTLVRAAAVAACAGSVLALPVAAALADTTPAAAAAAAPRTFVKSLALADGVSTARVYRVGEVGYEADIVTGDGAKVSYVASRGGVVGYGGTESLKVSLQPDGRLSSRVSGPDDGTPSGRVAGRKTATRTGAGRVDPAFDRTGTAAGAAVGTAAAGPAEALRLNTLADGPGEGVLLVTAGGGMAAVGAAGLGFAMLRRGRTDG